MHRKQFTHHIRQFIMTPFTPNSDVWFVFRLLACRYIYNSRLLLSEELWWSEPVTKSPSHFFLWSLFWITDTRDIRCLISLTGLYCSEGWWHQMLVQGDLSDRRRFRSRWEIRLVFGFLTDSTTRKGCPWNNDEVCQWIWTFFVRDWHSASEVRVIIYLDVGDHGCECVKTEEKLPSTKWDLPYLTHKSPRFWGYFKAQSDKEILRKENGKKRKNQSGESKPDSSNQTQGLESVSENHSRLLQISLLCGP